MHRFSLPLILLFLCVYIQSSHAGCAAGYTQEEIDAVLEAAPWEDVTHSHGPYGEHYHAQWFRQVELPAGCLHSEHGDFDHPEIETEPEKKEIPVVEGYTNPFVLVCVAGSCLDKEKPNQVIGPVDLEGNVPPEPEPGDPEIFYPIIEVDGKNYWDSTQEPYQVSEAAKNAKSPEGYRLEDIDGKLFLVPYGDKQEDIPVEASEETHQQKTFIIYRHVNVVGGQDYLEPTPFHAHLVDDSTEERIPTGVDPGGNQQSEDNQGQEESQEGLDIQEDGAGKTFASLLGKFYQITSTPAIPLQVTEYMMDTWGNGQAKLPQWIEIYNPNALAVNLVGYEFAYVFKKQIHSIKLGHFLIPPEGVIILATHIPHQRHRYEGITASQVYNLKNENALKQGWSLKDPFGRVISQTGKRFGEKGDPIKPERIGISRVSYNVYESERTRNPSFFGFRQDVSTPGFYEPQIPRSPVLLRQRMKTTWASMKKSQNENTPSEKDGVLH